ncbi:hypothetical protein [Halococcus hamelinensis]|uniref:Big-1 domain-containing protein n=1 Tax=Halococcus hamelinensis 100A6 TaxID=1132509 RepID=M0M6G2_9EURY|nr:hypothetical protein [Halococcus hamelinensis]EMA41402.1 hypothetical protein C447_01070 [Halococcus hamelinensis 100A6]
MGRFTQRAGSDEDRAVSPVVGFVLIFALVMIVFTVYQSSVVPAQNRAVEFEHSRTIESQLEQLSAAVVNTATAPEGASPTRRTTVQLGVRYPTRPFAVDPGTPVGSLESTEPRSVVVSGLDAERGDGTQTFNTTFVTYRPTYNQFSERREIALEYSMLLERYSGTDTVLADATDGTFGDDAVRLVLLSGDLDERAVSTVVTTERTGHWNTTVPSGGATVDLPTTLPRSQWQTILDEHGYARLLDYDDSPGTSRVRVHIDGGTRLAAEKVSIGEGTDDGFDLEPYLTNVTSHAPAVNADGNRAVVVRAVDEFGGPLGDVDLEATTNGSGTLEPASADAGDDGKASFVYTPGGDDGGRTVGVTVALADDESRSETFGLNYPAGDDGSANETSANRAPLDANLTNTGTVNRLAFEVRSSSLAVAGFAVVTKGDAAALNGTGGPNRFRIADATAIEGDSGDGPLRYASREPIRFDGQTYVFENGPRRVDSSTVSLSSWPTTTGVEATGVVDSYDEADVVVYLVLADGRRRPVYIDATTPDGTTTTAESLTRARTARRPFPARVPRRPEVREAVARPAPRTTRSARARRRAAGGRLPRGRAARRSGG